MRGFAAGAIALTASVLGATDAQLLYSLAAPTGGVEPGATIEVHLAVLNRSATDAMIARDASSGLALLEHQLAGPGPTRTALEIIPAPKPNARLVAAAAQRPTTNLARAEPGAGALRQIFADRFGLNEPIYLVYGTDEPAAKFPFSFKYKLLDFSDVTPQRMTRALQFAFTQRSLWDLEGASSPFYDMSYMPEIMYESLAPKPEQSRRWFTWRGFQMAYKHESNGRADRKRFRARHGTVELELTLPVRTRLSRFET